MKKTYILIAATLLALSGCHTKNSKPANYYTKMSDTAEYICRIQTPLGADTIAVSKRYDIQWPTGASKELKQRLIRIAFNDSTGTDDIKTVTDRYLDDMMLWEEDTLIQAVLTEDIPLSMNMNESEVSLSSLSGLGLQTFLITRYKYIHPGAHGMNWVEFVVHDSIKEQIVELTDLLDTNQLRPVIERAIEELEINEEVMECCFERDFMPLKPLTRNFYIDKKDRTLTLVYQPYEIAPYACGTMYVTMPIDWLRKQMKLTPYCKELFGIE
ncbi:MAG: DUF3298 domain-containing protein [Bacteroidales bacterium]|nr:DUF3298 domain-containing protein [Bacteroidales bacterium]